MEKSLGTTVMYKRLAIIDNCRNHIKLEKRVMKSGVIRSGVSGVVEGHALAVS